VIDVIASWRRLVRPNCRNAVIVRMRAGDLGVEPALWKNNFEEYYANERSGASWEERPAVAHSHRKNETPTNSVSESMP
jgi:hypothetical protein